MNRSIVRFQKKLSRINVCFTLLTILIAVLSSAKVAASAEFVWIEGEAPKIINVKPNISGWGHKEFLSGEKWLQISIDADKVEKELPAEGAILQYGFTLPKTGKQELWNRIGYEFVRSPFSWRVDSGSWSVVSPEKLTSDLMEMETWNEVAWLKMGDMQLTAGSHKLEIKIAKTKDSKGAFERVLYASDALCITPRFQPNSHFKPDEFRHIPIDLEAKSQVFKIPAATGAGRTRLALKGAWEICRNDENIPGPVAEPIKDFPANPIWTGIAVPGDKNTLRPDLLFAHRIWYRTKVEIPAEYIGRSLFLTFPQNNLNTTVYVNNVYCGFNKNPFAKFDIDITKGIKPGVNEIWVGIRDAYYGYSDSPKDPMKLRKRFNLPISFTSQGFQDLAYPVWGAFQSGILVTPEIVVAGGVYTSDVFCKSSVAKKQLSLDVSLKNTAAKSLSGEMLCEAVNVKSGKTEKSFTPSKFSILPGAETTLQLTESWDNAKLWWPDDPNLYSLRTTIKTGNVIEDISETSFGFREWSVAGTQFMLNGMNFHGWCDQHHEETKEQWLAFQRKTHQQMARLWGTSWYDLNPDQALDYFDNNGIVIRKQDMLDGEAIGYNAIENDPDLKSLYKSDIKMDLMKNWRDQVVAEIKGERNHPSIMLWSIENEWLYINCINLYGNLMDAFEAEVTKTAEAVQEVDPTRSLMVDGGGATAKQTLPVHGNHYITGPYQAYPELAYLPNVEGGARGRWTWDQKRPRFVGEDFYIAGNHPELSTLGGESAFQGKAASLAASGTMAKILTEGYRWAEYGAWDLYLGPDDTDGLYYTSNAQRAVFTKEWDWSFASGQTVKRSVGIFNDTHSAEPILFKRTLEIGGKQINSEQAVYQVPPGKNQKFTIDLVLPEVKQRTEGKWLLSLSAGGREVFSDSKSISILNTQPKATDAKIALFDPAGSVADYLKSRGIPFNRISDMNSLPEDAKLLVIGKDALTSIQSSSSQLAAYASSGRTVIVLEQKFPLRYQALPAEIDTSINEGRTAFAEDLDHPLMRGLLQKDFFTWGSDQVVYRNAYSKPARGAKSLIECDNLLQNSALVEVPTGKGVIIICQLLLEEKLSSNATAQQLLNNMISYGSDYKQVFRPVTMATPNAEQIQPVADSAGLSYTKSASALEAIQSPGSKIAVVAASPSNLKSLAGDLSAVKAFTTAGGWIVLNGLSPDGLESYNKLVGVDHMIRPFKRERVSFPPIRNPLTAGIPIGDIVMYSSQPIFNFQAGNYVVSDEFSYVVDIDEVAPFGKSSFASYDNIVNNFVNADGWPLIINYPVPASGPSDIPISFPKPQTISEFTWIGNTNYWSATKVNLIFDGKDKVELKTAPNGLSQTFAINPPRSASNITLELAEWQPKPNSIANLGIDNIYFKAERSPDFYTKVKPMLNIGAMVEYPQGAGGIILCNLNFKDHEEVPENALKKQTIFSSLLHNLNATFTGGKSIIAGANLNYQSIDISKQANQYRDDKGWFGDKTFTFKDIPIGRHNFAGVPYDVYDFPTSPVPTLIMLAGDSVPNQLKTEVKEIPVNLKADSLFFLQTARIDARRNDQEMRDKKQFEMFRYVVHYADGQQVEIPNYSEIDIEDYKQKQPSAIPGAQIAWVKRYEGTEFTAVAYSKQWNNPRPDALIKSIDMVYGKDKRGVPALLAITAAKGK